MAFHVMEFHDGLGLVSSEWLTKNKSACFYPVGYTKAELNKAVRYAVQPTLQCKKAKWTLCDITRYFVSAGKHDALSVDIFS